MAANFLMHSEAFIEAKDFLSLNISVPSQAFSLKISECLAYPKLLESSENKKGTNRKFFNCELL